MTDTLCITCGQPRFGDFCQCDPAPGSGLLETQTIALDAATHRLEQSIRALRAAYLAQGDPDAMDILVKANVLLGDLEVVVQRLKDKANR